MQSPRQRDNPVLPTTLRLRGGVRVKGKVWREVFGLDENAVRLPCAKRRSKKRSLDAEPAKRDNPVLPTTPVFAGE